MSLLPSCSMRRAWALGPSGGRRGHVTGTFFHAIAREEDLAGQQKIAKLA